MSIAQTAVPQAAAWTAGGVSHPASYPDDGAYRWMISLARHTPWLHLPAELWTSAGLVLPVLLALLGLWRRRAQGMSMVLRAAWVPGAMVVAFVLNSLVKAMVAEHRPCQVIVVKTVEKCPGLTDYAFPSNHAAIAAAGAVALFAVGRWYGAAGLAGALLVAASRVYLGVHYPHDVIVGCLAGGAVAGLGLLVGRPVVSAVLPVLQGAAGARHPEEAPDRVPR